MVSSNLTNNLKLRFNAIDSLLVFFLALSIFFWDILKNKLGDLGLGHQVIFKAGTTLPAVGLWYFSGILITVLLMALTLRAMYTPRGNILRDVLVGFIGMLGLVLLYGSALIEILTDLGAMPFFNAMVAPVNVYHFGGILTIILVGGYFAFVE